MGANAVRQPQERLESIFLRFAKPKHGGLIISPADNAAQGSGQSYGESCGACFVYHAGDRAIPRNEFNAIEQSRSCRGSFLGELRTLRNHLSNHVGLFPCIHTQSETHATSPVGFYTGARSVLRAPPDCFITGLYRSAALSS